MPMTWHAFVLNLKHLSNITLVNVIVYVNMEKGGGVPEGMGGNRDVRGPGAGSGAAEQHDGVCSTTVTGLAAGRGRKREASAVKRPVLPRFRPLTEGMPHPIPFSLNR